jgi:hypothetical protein
LKIYELIGLSFAVHRKLCFIRKCAPSTVLKQPCYRLANTGGVVHDLFGIRECGLAVAIYALSSVDGESRS